MRLPDDPRIGNTGWRTALPSAQRAAAILLVALSLWLLRYFLVPLAWATILAIANWPLYRRAARLFPGWAQIHITPLLLSTLITALVLGPVVFASGMLAEQLRDWAAYLASTNHAGLAAPAWLDDIPVVGARLTGDWNRAVGSPGGLSHWIRQANSSSLLNWAQSVGKLVLYHAFTLGMTVLALFLLFRRGQALELIVSTAIRRCLGQAGADYAQLAVAALRATLHSMVLICLCDGIVLGIVYALVKVPSAVAWGAVSGLLAMFPIVGYLAVAAVCAILVAHHANGSAILVAAAGVAVLFTSDKFVRPVLLAEKARLSVFGALAGTIGGLQTFGLLGMFVGPVVVALSAAICRDWLQGRPATDGNAR